MLHEQFYLELSHKQRGYYTEDENETPLTTLDKALAYYAALQRVRE